MRFVSSGILLWMMLGLIIAIALNYSKQHDFQKTFVIPVLPKRLLQIIIFLMTAYLMFVFYGFFQADELHSKAIQYSKAGNWDKAIERTERS
jgi:hypothetical protein